MKIKYTKLPPALPKFYKYVKENLLFRVKGNNLEAQFAARTCTRCGACLQKCPSFRALKSEVYSPRGRSQLVRCLYEGKLDPARDKKDILNSSQSCLMCGACSAFCPAQTPVADLMFFLNSVLGKKSLKLSVRLKNIFLLPFAKLKIKKALKNQPDLKEEIIFVPSCYSCVNIKKTVEYLNFSGFKVKADFSLIQAADYYFTANYPKLKKCFVNLNKNSLKNSKIVTDCAETYALLKKAQLLGEEFKEIPLKVCFITQFIKTSKHFKQDLKDKTVLLCRTCNAPDAQELNEQTENLLYCPKKLFLIKCNQSSRMSPAAAAVRTRIKGSNLLLQQTAEYLQEERPDYLITLSYTDEMFFKQLIKKYKLNIKVLHTLNIPQEFYAER